MTLSTIKISFFLLLLVTSIKSNFDLPTAGSLALTGVGMYCLNNTFSNKNDGKKSQNQKYNNRNTMPSMQNILQNPVTQKDIRNQKIIGGLLSLVGSVGLLKKLYTVQPEDAETYFNIILITSGIMAGTTEWARSYIQNNKPPFNILSAYKSALAFNSVFFTLSILSPLVTKK